MDAGERGQAHVAGRLGLLDRELERGGAGRVVAGLALRAAEARDLVGLGLQEAEPARRLRRAADVARRRRRSGARRGPARRASRRARTCSHGSSTLPASARPRRAPRRRARGRRPRSPRGRRTASSRPGPTAGRARVERVAAVGELERLLPLAVVGDDVGEVVARSAPAGRRRRSRQLRGRGDVLARGLEVAGRRLDPRREQQGASARSRAGAASPAASSAARIRCAPRLSPSTIQAQPNPLTIASASSGSCAGAPGQRGVDVRALGAREGEVLGLAARCARPAVDAAAAAANQAACAASARSVSPASAIASSANARMLSSSR